MSGFVEARSRRLLTTFGSMLLIVLAAELHLPTRVHGQTITSTLVGYSVRDNTALGLVGAQIAPARLGWRPVGSIEAFRLGYERGIDDRATLWSVSPGAGIQYAGVNGAFAARGSYQVVADENSGPQFFSGGESGFAATVEGQYWRLRPAVEALARHNFASNFLWTQAQAYLPVIAAPPGSIDVGAEYVFQGDFDDDETRAQMVGPLVRWATGTGVFVMLSGGLKNNFGPTGDTWYGRAALALAP